jgi:hypothetical protein
MWSPLLPAAVRGTYYDGLVHISDFAPTYVEGLAGGKFTAAPGTYNVTSVNLWPSIIDPTVPAPRTEVILSVQSAAAPADCDVTKWLGRACTAAMRLGDMKLILGPAGDPRMIPVNKSIENAVEFGHSGGNCDGEHCQSKGYHGPDKNGPIPCQHGCLFNLTADPSESNNLYEVPNYARVVQEMTDRLAAAGASGK